MLVSKEMCIFAMLISQRMYIFAILISQKSSHFETCKKVCVFAHVLPNIFNRFSSKKTNVFSLYAIFNRSIFAKVSGIFCFKLKEERHKNKLAFRSLLFESAVHACKFKANSYGRRCDSSTLEFNIHFKCYLTAICLTTTFYLLIINE